LAALLEIVGLEMTTKSVGAGMERVQDFRSCNAEAAGAKWSANKRNREQIRINNMTERVEWWARKAEYTGWDKKNSPEVFWKFFPKGWDFV